MPIVNLIGTPVFESEVLPKGGKKVGTRSVFSEDLRDKNSNQPVGRHSGTCTLVREPGWWLCHAGWTLENVGPGAGKTGTLVAGALLDFLRASRRSWPRSSAGPATSTPFGGKSPPRLSPAPTTGTTRSSSYRRAHRECQLRRHPDQPPAPRMERSPSSALAACRTHHPHWSPAPTAQAVDP
jgi:hypothetical protein